MVPKLQEGLEHVCDLIGSPIEYNQTHFEICITFSVAVGDGGPDLRSLVLYMLKLNPTPAHGDKKGTA